MATPRGPKKPLGQILLQKGLITQEQLDEALKVQKNTTEQVGRILVDLGYVTDRDVLRARKPDDVPYNQEIADVPHVGNNGKFIIKTIFVFLCYIAFQLFR